MFIPVVVLQLFCQIVLTPAAAFPQPLPEQIITVDQPLPKVAAQYDYFGGRGGSGTGFGGFGGNTNGFGGGGASNGGGDTVNFDFQCKCQAKSALARNLLNSQTTTTPGTDPQQQQIAQLREQIQKLQSQVDRSQQGKSPFEQFAQMLAMADGLDCNCSGQSTPWSGWPSGVSNGGVGNTNNHFGGGAIPNNPFGGIGASSNSFPGARGNYGGGQSLSQMLGTGGGAQYPFPMGAGGGAGGGRMPMMMGGGGNGGGYPFMMGPLLAAATSAKRA